MIETPTPVLALLYLFATASVFQPLSAAEQVVLVEDGVAKVPIILFENAPPKTRRAAVELADYIEMMTGARLEVIEGLPDPLPAGAIWVGYQPVLDELFPGTEFDFNHPEEIVIVADDNHLVVAGRDRWNPDHMTITRGGKWPRTHDGIQQEYGTANAVYTLLQDFLGVRWLWPGELGTDVIETGTIAFEPFEYRYHPSVRARVGLMYFNEIGDGRGYSRDWFRFQRCKLDSLDTTAVWMRIAGHAYGDWWDRFAESNPEYFALQPDGTRGGGVGSPYPSSHQVKMCDSNPDFHNQWLADVEAILEESPNRKVFNASPNDGGLQGFCICDGCTAWDHPDSERYRYRWKGVSQEYVAMSDRVVTLANTLGRLLRKRYPDKDYYVAMASYASSSQPPAAAIPDDNVIIIAAQSFFLSSGREDRHSMNNAKYRDQFAKWAAVSENIFWRPNPAGHNGWYLGLPDVPFNEITDDFKFAFSEHGSIGVFLDGLWEFWATQGPVYYLMAHLIWDPDIDVAALMQDYYQRGFGKAAPQIEAYWNLLESKRNQREASHPQTIPYWELYDDAFFAAAEGYLSTAAGILGNEPEKFRLRVDFTRTGLEYTRYAASILKNMDILRKSGGSDATARTNILADWEKINELAQSEEFPIAFPKMWTLPSHRFMRAMDPDRL